MLASIASPARVFFAFNPSQVGLKDSPAGKNSCAVFSTSTLSILFFLPGNAATAEVVEVFTFFFLGENLWSLAFSCAGYG